jgi:hypothetical protein
MISGLLPQPADNAYRGHPGALWLFGLLVAAKLAIAVNTMFRGSTVAQTADGIPLDTFAPDAAQTVVSLFGLLGVLTFTLCVLCVVVLVRYRSLIPFMFVVLLFEYGARKLFLQAMPIPRTGAEPGLVINLVLVGLMLIGLVLSLMKRSAGPPANAT